MKKNKIKKFLILCSILICTVMAVIAGMPGESPGEKVVRQILTVMASNALDADIEAESLDFSFPGKLSVKGLNIKKPDLRISGLNIDLHFKRIIFCGLIVEEVIVSLPEKTAEKEMSPDRSAFRLPALPPFFCMIRVHDFYASGDSHDIRLNAENISLDMAGIGRTINVSAYLPSLQFKTDTLTIQALDLELKGGIHKNTAHLASLSGKIQSALIKGSAFYSPEKGPEGFLKAEGDLSVLLKPFFSE